MSLTRLLYAAPKSLGDMISAFVLLVASAAVLFRLWTSFCFFLLPEWNSVRLAPTFMLRFGPTPYPGTDAGPLTTWIYGPVPLFGNLPATLAADPISALLVAGGINLLCALLPLALLAGTIASPLARGDRMWVLLLGAALWPNTSLHYIQADNVALALGLCSNVLLVRAQTTNTGLLPAALCAALAVWSKQTAVGLVLAQGLWLAFAAGSKTCISYFVTQAALLLALAGAFVAWFGFGALWLNLVQIPGQLPSCPDLMERTLLLWKHLAGDVLLPLVALVVFRHAIWRRNSPWLLPVFTWLSLLPTGLISAYKIGGAANSLNGYLYLLVPAVAAFVSLLQRRSPRRAPFWTTAAVLGVTFLQLGAAPLLPVRPMTTHLEQAIHLARTYPNQVYFPWHPLVTWYSDRRFYHTEDGLYTRHVAGIELTRRAVVRDLPSQWSLTAVPGWREEGMFRRFQPARPALNAFGKWSLFSWAPGGPQPPTERTAAPPFPSDHVR